MPTETQSEMPLAANEVTSTDRRRAALATQLLDARARTLLLIAPLSDDDLQRQHDPLMGPLIWDLGHIAHFEELWLLNNLEGEIRFGEMPGLFNPFEHPRATRGKLQLPGRRESLELLAETRTRVLAALSSIDLDNDNPLVRDGYVYRMVLQHEYQHNETMLQTLQLKQGEPYAAPRAQSFGPPALPIEPGAMVRIPGGRVAVGTNDRTAAYDNERPRHEIELNAYWMDTAPVTNDAYRAFIEDGGYTRDELWSDAGRAWRDEDGVQAPKYWFRSDSGWHTRTMNRTQPIDDVAQHPVCHVSWFEAEAYARWQGKRLPTEAEWEAAACWDFERSERRDYPWGDDEPTALHANVDQLAFGTSPIGTFARNVSPSGCYGMIGDVWEWTASDFAPYPGYRTFPYPEYSEVFFGSEYKVLRGGAWATRAGAIRGSFRNWDYPIRRQIFSGFRCARDD